MINIDKVSITTLSENSVADVGFIAEWGFSAHVAIQGGPSILFDTGNGMACTHNAEAAGIRLADIDMIVLSHGHTDHTGGLRPVLQKANGNHAHPTRIDVLCHQAAIESQHVKHADRYYFRGCPYHIEELEQLGANFKTGSDPVWITEDIVTSGEVPMTTEFESVSSICYLKTDQGYVHSPVADDQALFLITSLGLIIVLGCAHRGMINTIRHARRITGVDDVYLVIGGTHLLNTTMAQQEATLAAIEALGVEKVGVSHCTGMRAASFLYQGLGPKRFFFNNAGTGITFRDGKMAVKAFETYEV